MRNDIQEIFSRVANYQAASGNTGVVTLTVQEFSTLRGALQSISQEAVRNEALEKILDRRCTNPKPVGDSACDCCQHHWFAILGHTPIGEYRALKREPNAVGQAHPSGIASSDSPLTSGDLQDATDRLSKPAPAAPDVTSRPATPESLVERAVQRLRDNIARREADGDVEALKSVLTEMDRLATAYALAQTEIKGHMRIKDDLKRDTAIYQSSIEKFGERHGREIAQAKARIAELERNLALYYSQPGEKWAAAWASCDRDRKELEVRAAALEKVLRGIIAEADRDTDPFIAARALLKGP